MTLNDNQRQAIIGEIRDLFVHFNDGNPANDFIENLWQNMTAQKLYMALGNFTRMAETDMTATASTLDLKDELIEVYGDCAIDAFLECWSIDDLKHFEDVFLGCFGSDEEFAEERIFYHEATALSPKIAIDWKETWNNIKGDYVEQDAHYFLRNW